MRRNQRTRRKNRSTLQRRSLLGGIESLEKRRLLTVTGFEHPADLATDTVANVPAIIDSTHISSRAARASSIRIVNGEQTSNYGAVGIVNDGCTGTLISPTHVLTAGHCVEGVGNSQGTFEVNGETFSTVKVVSHPQYDANNFDLGNDLAIMELSRPVSGIQPMQILRDAPTVGQNLTLVGFGEGGTTSNPTYDFGNKRVGETPIDEITNAHIIWHFDNNSESNTAPGDSGGPAFVTIDGQQYIAGVTSGGDGDPHQLGDRSFDTRVDLLAGWIDSVVGNVTPNPDPDPDPNPDPDPTPDPTPDPDDNPDATNSELDGDVHVDQIGPDATPIDLEDGVFGFVDAVVNSDHDQDVFQITLTGGGTVYLDLFSWDGDLDTTLQVFDIDGAIVSDNNDSYGTTDSSLILELDAGTYYLMAASEDASTGEYGLDVYVTSLDGGDFGGGDFGDGDFGDGDFGDGDFGDGDFGDWGGDDQTPGGDGFDDEWIVGEDTWDGLGDFDFNAGDDQWDWTNEDSPWDVNADGYNTPADVLLVLNYLNTGAGGTLSARDDGSDLPYLDVNGDKVVSPGDALMVINNLNKSFLGSQADSPQPRIVNGEQTSNYGAVGIVNDGCTGTLISPTHVLTAGHCVEGVGNSQGTFEVNGETFSTVKVVSHPQYDANNFDLGNDLAIMELSRPVSGIQPMQILRDAPTVGQNLTLVGFGEGGTTSNPTYDFGNKRVGETPIDEITNAHIIWHFDNNSESNTAPGDSGGPAFVTIDGQQYIAGVTSGGDGDPHQLGDRSFDTRVDLLAGWIDSVVGNVTPNPDPDPDPNPDPDPTPDPTPDPDDNPDATNSELDGDVHVDQIGPDATSIDLEDGVFGFVDAVVNSDHDQDVFQITLTGGGTVYLDLFSWDGDLDTTLQAFDIDGAIVSDNNDSYGTTDSSLILELDAGTYYLMAASEDASTGEYGLDVYVTSLDGGDFGGGDFGDGDFGDGDFGDGDFGDGDFGDSDFGDWDFADWGGDDQTPGDDGFDDAWIVDEDDWDWSDSDDGGSDSLDDIMGEDINWTSDAFGLV